MDRKALEKRLDNTEKEIKQVMLENRMGHIEASIVVILRDIAVLQEKVQQLKEEKCK